MNPTYAIEINETQRAVIARALRDGHVDLSGLFVSPHDPWGPIGAPENPDAVARELAGLFEDLPSQQMIAEPLHSFCS